MYIRSITSFICNEFFKSRITKCSKDVCISTVITSSKAFHLEDDGKLERVGDPDLGAVMRVATVGAGSNGNNVRNGRYGESGNSGSCGESSVAAMATRVRIGTVAMGIGTVERKKERRERITQSEQ